MMAARKKGPLNKTERPETLWVSVEECAEQSD
jgi:hypothetical protein